jgi:excisionase family DNA binding protein
VEAVLLSKNEASQVLNLSLRTIDNLIARGELMVRRVGRRVLIPTTELQKFAATSARRPAHVAETSPVGGVR